MALEVSQLKLLSFAKLSYWSSESIAGPISVESLTSLGYSRVYGDIFSHKIFGAHTKLFREVTCILSHFEIYRKYITS